MISYNCGSTDERKRERERERQRGGKKKNGRGCDESVSLHGEQKKRREEKKKRKGGYLEASSPFVRIS